MKTYMAHVEELLGTSLVRSAAASRAFSKRDLGELKSMAMELSRQSLGKIEENAQIEYGQLLALLMQDLALNLDKVARATDVEQRTLKKWLSGDTSALQRAERIRIVAQLIVIAQQSDAKADSPFRTAD